MTNMEFQSSVVAYLENHYGQSLTHARQAIPADPHTARDTFNQARGVMSLKRVYSRYVLGYEIRIGMQDPQTIIEYFGNMLINLTLSPTHPQQRDWGLFSETAKAQIVYMEFISEYTS